ncbi:alkaline phosphatase family protein [Tundrisphaera sp. TA3]|uniref:alkaline phosphatase family protein n=1 Tax=Tundrisphaera sp. TA3 TaxID=3435775 RepID=UPI003EBF7D86
MLALLLIAGTVRAADAPDRNVVVITIDGLPAYLLDDPQASLPEIRALRAKGAWSEAGMIVSNPSVTWPNHTTLMTGVHPERHGVLFNGVLERQGKAMPARVVPAKTQAELVGVPLLFDVIKAKGMTSAAINWPCTRGSSSIDDNFPDVPDQLRYTTPRLKEELAQSGHLARFERGGPVNRDDVWTEAACRVILNRMPRLMAFHLLNLDGTHHKYGPRTTPGYTAAALTDANVGRVLRALDQAGVRDRTTVIILADHGFSTVKKALRPNVALRRRGFLATDGNAITSARVQVIPEGGIGMVYLNDPDTADQDREAVKKLFAEAEGVESILGPEDFPRLHMPKPGPPGAMCDLILVPKAGYSVAGDFKGEDEVVANDPPTGSHGYLSTVAEMNAVFVASGAGIKAGATLPTVDNVDVAPTVARLLGTTLDQSDGRVLEEILDAGH